MIRMLLAIVMVTVSAIAADVSQSVILSGPASYLTAPDIAPTNFVADPARAFAQMNLTNDVHVVHFTNRVAGTYTSTLFHFWTGATNRLLTTSSSFKGNGTPLLMSSNTLYAVSVAHNGLSASETNVTVIVVPFQ